MIGHRVEYRVGDEGRNSGVTTKDYIHEVESKAFDRLSSSFD